MVIFGKKAKQLIDDHKRLKDAYDGMAGNFSAHGKLINALQDENKLLKERVNNLETELKELALVVENNFENGTPKKTPQQLLREWFSGKEDDR